jgi:predicted membrane protein
MVSIREKTIKELAHAEASTMKTKRVFSAKTVALVGIFAALNVVTDSFAGMPEFPSGVWYSWNFLIVPLTGIILGPWLGFAATFTGVMIGHYIYFIDAYEFLFTVGAPIGAMVTAFLYVGKWKPVLAYYAALFATYFLTPVSRELPFWGMWDTYVAFVLLIAVIVMTQRSWWKDSSEKLPLILTVVAFVGLEADVLFRISVLVPGQAYKLYGWNVETLKLIWSAGAVGTPVKAALSTFATVAIGPPLLRILRKAGLLASHSIGADSTSL